MVGPKEPGSGVSRVAQRFQEACSQVLNGPAFEGVYLSPLWDLPAPPGIVAWKRSVLRRKAEGGAEPWGHLFLVEESRTGGFALEELNDTPTFSHLRSLPLEGPWALEAGPPAVWLLLRPRDEESRTRLAAFATALRALWSRS